MSMTFEEMKARMCAAGSMEVGKGASEAEIAVAEKTLGVPIQGDYRRFLLEFGWGGAESLELFGLGADVPRHLDLVEITLSERTEMHPRLPHHLLPLMNNGGSAVSSVRKKLAFFCARGWPSCRVSTCFMSQG